MSGLTGIIASLSLTVIGKWIGKMGLLGADRFEDDLVSPLLFALGFETTPNCLGLVLAGSCELGRQSLPFPSFCMPCR